MAGPGAGAGPDASTLICWATSCRVSNSAGAPVCPVTGICCSSWRGPGRALDAGAAASPLMMNGGELRSPGRAGDSDRPLWEDG